MTSQRSSSPLKEKNHDSVISKLLLPLKNMVLQNHERADFSFIEPSQNNELWSIRRHIASMITPPSENLLVFPNAPLKRRNHVPKKRLRPRRLFYDENQQDTSDNGTIDEWKEKLPLSQVTSDTKGTVLRNKSPELSNKENQECSGDKLRNMAKNGEERGKIYNLRPLIAESKRLMYLRLPK